MTRNAGGKLQVTVLLVVASFVLGHLCFLLLPDVFVAWNAQTVDQLFLYRSSSGRFRPSYDSTVVHVDLNDSSIELLQDFYLNRSHYAQVARNLAAMGVAAQLYDFIFPARTFEEHDRALIEATSASGHTYFGLAFALSERSPPSDSAGKNSSRRRYIDRTGWPIRVRGDSGGLLSGTDPLITFPDLSSASRGLGFLNAQPDRDGVFRRLPLLVRYGDSFYPSLPFRAVCDYLGVPPEGITVTPGEHIVLKDARRPGGSARDIVIPIDGRGNIIVNFLGPWERMDHYNFAGVLRASDDRDELDMWREELSGRIAIISEVSTGSSDVGPVPTDPHYPLSGLHATVIHNILSGSFLRELSGGGTFLVELLLLALILILSLRLSSLTFTFSSLAAALAYVGVVALCFLAAGLILNLIRPLLMVTFAVISTVTYHYFVEEKEKWLLRQSFEAYFPPSIVQRIMENPETITSGGQKKELTILFSDIKGFSTHSAEMDPDHVQELLNDYFEAMTDIVFRYEGTVDKFMGDGLMVFFGDPEPQPDHAVRAVRAAIDMQKKIRELKTEWDRRGDMPLQVRIGINTGEVVVGNMGSARRLDYTVLGADVNLAQRLESNAPVESIMISHRTCELVKDEVETQSLGEIQVKGFEDPVSVYEVSVDGQASV